MTEVLCLEVCTAKYGVFGFSVLRDLAKLIVLLASLSLTPAPGSKAFVSFRLSV